VNASTFIGSSSKLARCDFTEDPSLYDSHTRRRYCTCGLPEAHARHRPEPTPPFGGSTGGGRRERERMTVTEANELLASYGGWRKAVKITHPDHGGDAALFRKVQEARDVLRDR